MAQWTDHTHRSFDVSLDIDLAFVRGGVITIGITGLTLHCSLLDIADVAVTKTNTADKRMSVRPIGAAVSLSACSAQNWRTGSL
jgi:hypothetical protein